MVSLPDQTGRGDETLNMKEDEGQMEHIRTGLRPKGHQLTYYSEATQMLD